MKMNSGLWTKCIAGLATVGWILPLMGAPAPAAADGGRGAGTVVREVAGITAPDVSGGGAGVKAGVQSGARRSTPQAKPAQDRSRVGAEMFDLIAFPFFVILFTGAGLVLYLGAIAWLPAPWEEGTSPKEV